MYAKGRSVLFRAVAWSGFGARRRETKKVNKGARGMPVALGGEEGRDKLRKAAVRGKCPVTRGCPNGETRRERSRHLA